MALIKCSECGKEISDKATYCIHCGYESDRMECPDCGKSMYKNTYCKNCGYNLKSIDTSTTLGDVSKKNSFALVGLILGLCSILAWLIPLLGYPCSIVGIIFSSISLKSEKKDMAIAGLILSIIFLIATIINSFAGAIIGSSSY